MLREFFFFSCLLDLWFFNLSLWADKSHITTCPFWQPPKAEQKFTDMACHNKFNPTIPCSSFVEAFTLYYYYYLYLFFTQSVKPLKVRINKKSHLVLKTIVFKKLCIVPISKVNTLFTRYIDNSLQEWHLQYLLCLLHESSKTIYQQENLPAT